MPHPEIESLLRFWSDAGVAYALAEEAQDRRLSLKAAPAPGSGSAPPGAAPAEPRIETSAEAGGAALLELAVRAAAEARDLSELEAAAAAFPHPLARTGAGAALVRRGGPESAVLVIGDSPAAEDVRAGRLMAGPSGRLLERMLSAAGLEPALVSHLVFWRTPGDRPPSPEEAALCRPFLDRLLGLAAPRLVLLLGAGPAAAFLGGTEPILRRRGRFEPLPTAPGAVALATLQPAFLLRRPELKKLVWADLLAARERLRSA